MLRGLKCLLVGSLPLSVTLGFAQSEIPAAPNPEKATPKKNFVITGQVTTIGQVLLPFHSSYEAASSLKSPSTPAMDWTDTYTLYLGWRIARCLEFYVDPEMARGAGVGGAAGLAGYPNGDVLRVPGAGIGALPESPYLARYFARWILPTGSEMVAVPEGQNQIGEDVASNRIVMSVGKMSTADIFDQNAYANNTRTQFMNWALINNAAYDYAADTRGYSDGLAVEWIHPAWTFRLGVFEMPVIPNGPVLATNLSHDHGDQAELEIHPKFGKGFDPATVRFLAYRNTAHMGNYEQAIAVGKQTGNAPNITATERDGAVKYGFGLNLDQALADNGETGVFARLGWDDGKTESYAYTECDNQLSFGTQVSGKHWHAPKDHMGIALASNGLSDPHRDYLAAGGSGFLLGDGKLKYGRENIVEVYYSHYVLNNLTATLDGQVIQNPGYNQDRGPSAVLSMRLHWEF